MIWKQLENITCCVHALLYKRSPSLCIFKLKNAIINAVNLNAFRIHALLSVINLTVSNYSLCDSFAILAWN